MTHWHVRNRAVAEHYTFVSEADARALLDDYVHIAQTLRVLIHEDRPGSGKWTIPVGDRATYEMFIQPCDKADCPPAITQERMPLYRQDRRPAV